MLSKKASDPPTEVFINCPFDDAYAPMFRSIVFTIAACGYRSRCALEDNDSGNPRLQKLKSMIVQCDLGIHDLSRTELSGKTGTPRFNMPFELGLFLGARHFGGVRQRRKRALVLAESRVRWAPSISDLAGVDPVFHSNDPLAAIQAVRDFLSRTPGGKRLPGEAAIAADYERFSADLFRLASAARQTIAEAKRYLNYVAFVGQFLLARPPEE